MVSRVESLQDNLRERNKVVDDKDLKIQALEKQN